MRMLVREYFFDSSSYEKEDDGFDVNGVDHLSGGGEKQEEQIWFSVRMCAHSSLRLARPLPTYQDYLVDASALTKTLKKQNVERALLTNWNLCRWQPRIFQIHE